MTQININQQILLRQHLDSETAIISWLKENIQQSTNVEPIYEEYMNKIAELNRDKNQKDDFKRNRETDQKVMIQFSGKQDEWFEGDKNSDMIRIHNEELEISALKLKMNLKSQQKEYEKLENQFLTLSEDIDEISRQLTALQNMSVQKSQSLNNDQTNSIQKQSAYLLQQLQQTDQEISYLLEKEDKCRQELQEVQSNTKDRKYYNIQQCKKQMNNNIKELQGKIFVIKEEKTWKEEELMALNNQKNSLVMAPKFNDDSQIAEESLSHNMQVESQSGEIPIKKNKRNKNSQYDQKVIRQAKKRSQQQILKRQQEQNRQKKAVRVLWNVIKRGSSSEQIKSKAQAIIKKYGLNEIINN